jgi:hypothetical protein
MQIADGNRHSILDNETDSATVASRMTDNNKMPNHVPSRLMKGFGSVTPIQKPEEYRLIREDMEAVMAEEVSAEDHSPNADT